MIREETRGGAELVEFALTVLRNGNVRQRQWAVDWLADRGFGKAVQVNTVRAEQVDELVERMGKAARTALSAEDFERLCDAWLEVGLQLQREDPDT